MRSVPSILLVQLRRDEDRLIREREAFARGLDLPVENLVPVNASSQKIHPPLLTKVDGVVFAGSPCMVHDATTPQIRELEELVFHAHITSKPTLGVCFGAQLIAQAFRGEVETSDDAREYGTTEIELTRDAKLDPLYVGLPKRFAVQQNHHAHISTLPPIATVLATNASCIQAFRVSALMHGVQFHPERTKSDAEWIHTRHPTRESLPSLRETPHAPKILRTFRTML